MFDPRRAAATAARLPHGAAPPVGAALCDALLFPSQRRQTLLLAAAAAHSRDEELPPLWGGPSREGRLPLWYLVFANFFFFGCTATATSIIQSVLLPAQMATAAAHLHTSKNAALGVCAAIGAATQLVQPVVGAWSDGIGAWSRSPSLLGGQLLMCGGCVLMLYSSSPTGLTVSYTIFMMGSSIGWGVYLALLPEYIPLSQHGTAAGIQAVMAVFGSVFGSMIGYATGASWLSLSFVYWYCTAVNLLVGVQGWISLGAHRQLQAMEATKEAAAAATAAAVAARGRAGAGEVDDHQGNNTVSTEEGFLSSFRSPPFAALFTAITLCMTGPMLMGTFLEYYLKFVANFTFFGTQVATSAESATAVFNTVSGIASFLTANLGGYLSSRIGGRQTLALSFCVAALSLAPLAFTANFTVTLCCGAFGFGLSSGLYQGAVPAVMALCCPNTGKAARDMNILVTGPVFTQMALTAGGGYALSAIQAHWSASDAWSFLWLVSASFFFLALPALLPIRVSARDS